MITDETYAKNEAQIKDLFHEAGWVVPEVVNYERIDRISDRAMFQNVIKESTTFVFVSFTSAITGFCAAFFGSVAGSDEIDYRP